MPNFWRQLGHHRRQIAAYVVVGLGCFLGYFMLPQPGSAVSYLTLSGLPMLAIAAGVRRHRPSDVLPWLMLILGQGAFFLGDMIW